MGNRARQAKRRQRDPPAFYPQKKKAIARSADVPTVSETMDNSTVQEITKFDKTANNSDIEVESDEQDVALEDAEKKLTPLSENEQAQSDAESQELQSLSDDSGLENLDDLSEASETQQLFSDDEFEDQTEFEKEAEKEDLEAAENEELAKDEMLLNIQDGEQLILPSGEEIQMEADLNQDMQVVSNRIGDLVRILSNFKKEADPNRNRSEYVDQLLKDIAHYYGYNSFLAEKLFHLFPIGEITEFFEANETPRPVVIRTNTLKTRRRELAQTLINRGVTLQPIGKWSKVGIQVFDSTVPIGATPEYLGGHYILQAAASFLPVIALNPQENERVLDMCAAPGGKTTYISAIMKNTGCIYANDISKDRLKALNSNLHRLGCTNVVSCDYDGREFPNGVTGGFDRVLLDAPCSGTGVISKDPSVKTSKSQQDFDFLSQVQRELILAAIDSCDAKSATGGIVVYSTCSITVEENEAVVNYALLKRPNVKLVETGITFGRDGFTSYRGKQFHPSMKLVKRYYPHTQNMDGFFVAKFKKTSNKIPTIIQEDEETPEVGLSTIEEEEVTFNDSEDEKYMQGSPRSNLELNTLETIELTVKRNKVNHPKKVIEKAKETPDLAPKSRQENKKSKKEAMKRLLNKEQIEN